MLPFQNMIEIYLKKLVIWVEKIKTFTPHWDMLVRAQRPLTTPKEVVGFWGIWGIFWVFWWVFVGVLKIFKISIWANQFFFTISGCHDCSQMLPDTGCSFPGKIWCSSSLCKFFPTLLWKKYRNLFAFKLEPGSYHVVFYILWTLIHCSFSVLREGL